MPNYEYRCTPCNASKTEVKKVDERDNCPLCDECKLKMERTVSQTSPPKFNAPGFTPKFHR